MAFGNRHPGRDVAVFVSYGDSDMGLVFCMFSLCGLFRRLESKENQRKRIAQHIGTLRLGVFLEVAKNNKNCCVLKYVDKTHIFDGQLSSNRHLEQSSKTWKNKIYFI